MKARQEQGSTLILTAASVVMVSIIGVLVTLLIQLFGGAREVQHATDAGSLNVAKTALSSPSIPLAGDSERDTFGRALGKGQLVNLGNYNRVVGTALLVGLNAKELGTTEALTHARTVASLAQSGDNSIGNRLSDTLKKHDSMQGAFRLLANSNSTRMFNGKLEGIQSGSYAVAYLDKGEPANVHVDNATAKRLPAGVLTGSGGSRDKRNYMKGYQSISLGSGLNYYMVPISPVSGAHLVSDPTFQAGGKEILGTKVPPNAFRTLSSTNGVAGKLALASNAITGSAGRVESLSMPGGYIKIVNPKGFMSVGAVETSRTIYTDELMSGIFLLGDAAGRPVAFTTDPAVAADWQQYNQDPQSHSRPPMVDGDNNPLVFDANGQAASSALLESVRTLPGPSAGCNNVTGFTDPACHQMLGAMEKAFPAQDEVQPGNKEQFTVIEKTVEIMRLKWTELVHMGFTHNWSAGAVIEAPKGYSGMKLIDRSRTYIGQALDLRLPLANVSQLVGLCGPKSAQLMAQLKERIHQIKPESSDGEINALLQSQVFPLDSVWYISMDNDDSRKLTLSPSLPTAGAAAAKADGRMQTFTSGKYTTIRSSIDAPRWIKKSGAPAWVFEGAPHPASTLLAEDVAQWTPSSGFKGLLGVLEFRETCQGGGYFAYPN